MKDLLMDSLDTKYQLRDYEQFQDVLIEHVRSQLKANSTSQSQTNFKEQLASDIERVILLAGTDKMPIFNEPQHSHLSALPFAHRLKCRIFTILLLTFLETYRLQDICNVRPQFQYRKIYSQQLQKLLATTKVQMSMQDLCFQSFLSDIVKQIDSLASNVQFRVYSRQIMRQFQMWDDLDGGEHKIQKMVQKPKNRQEQQRKNNMEQMKRMASRRRDRLFVLIHR